MEFNALVHEFAVAEISASLDFYVGRLGFELEYERQEEGFAFLSFGGAQLMLDQIGLGRTFETAPFEPPLGRGCNLQIAATPQQLEHLLQSLDTAGAPLFLAAEEKWYRQGPITHGQKQFAVADPDGYLLRFSCDLGWREASA